MRFKQVAYRGNGKLVALDTLGRLWETRTDFTSRRGEWHRLDEADMKVPVLSITAQGDRILAIDGDRVLWQQHARVGGMTPGGSGMYEWRRLDMPVIEE